MSNVKRIILEPVKERARQTPMRLRVAAYCRVSTDTEDQRTSFEGQVKTYTKQIEGNPDWTLAGIYADEGITGTSVDKRPEFLRMVKDCEDGKIDLVLTKSISRFARNTLECLTYVRHLNNIGVNIIFESNHIDTRNAWDAVQEKLRARREDIEQGIKYHGGRTHFLYGKVFCGCCGSPMTRRTLTAYGGSKYKAWVCRDRHLGRKGNGCLMRTMKEDDLLRGIKAELGFELSEESVVLLDRVDVLMDDLEVYPARARISV